MSSHLPAANMQSWSRSQQRYTHCSPWHHGCGSQAVLLQTHCFLPHCLPLLFSHSRLPGTSHNPSTAQLFSLEPESFLIITYICSYGLFLFLLPVSLEAALIYILLSHGEISVSKPVSALLESVCGCCLFKQKLVFDVPPDTLSRSPDECVVPW